MPSDSRHSVGVTCLPEARAMALGEQVTPTEERSFHCQRAIERTLLRSVCNSTYWLHGWYSRRFRTASDEVRMREILARKDRILIIDLRMRVGYFAGRPSQFLLPLRICALQSLQTI